MERKMSMEASQIALLVTENEEVYQQERMRDQFFQDPPGQGATKEPTLPLIASGIYPLEYVMDFLKIAKKNKASHIMVKLGRKDMPIQLGFRSDDKLNNNENKLTYLWLAGRVDSEEPATLDEVNKEIEVMQNEVKKLVDRQTQLLREKAADEQAKVAKPL